MTTFSATYPPESFGVRLGQIWTWDDLPRTWLVVTQEDWDEPFDLHVTLMVQHDGGVFVWHRL